MLRRSYHLLVLRYLDRFLLILGIFWIASEIEQNITPDFANSVLKVVPTETLSKTASTATFDRRFCSLIEIPNFSESFK